MPFAEKPGAAVEEDRGDAAQRSALAHPLEVLEQALDRQPERVGRRLVGLRHDRHVALELADNGDVELRQLDRVELARRRGHGGAWRARPCRPTISRSMLILKSVSVGQLADRLGARQALKDLERAVEPQLRVGLGGDREPEVELVVAQVVVRDAGVRVDDLRRPVRVLRVDLRRDEHRAVPERARVEDRRDLADDALVDQVLNPSQHLVLGHLGQLGDSRIRPPLQRELALHQVHYPLVDLVERDRRAVLARAQLRLRPYCASHRATSFAW